MARDLGDGVDAGQDVGLGAAKGGGYEETEEVGVAQFDGERKLTFANQPSERASASRSAMVEKTRGCF